MTVSYGSLSGSFRLQPREYGAVNYLRYNKRMSMNHIAELIGRSTASIHRVLVVNPLERIDNRGQRQSAYAVRKYQFDHNRTMMKLSLHLWFRGLVDSLTEAFDERVVKHLVSENSGDEEDQDPA